MKIIRYALLLALGTLAVGCACKDSGCCKRTASSHHSCGIMMEGSF